MDFLFHVNQKGMTLLELLAALTLIAIVTGAATLRYPEIVADWRLDAGARQVVLDLRETRLQAIAEGVSHRLQFSLDADTYVHQRREKRGYEDDGPPLRLPPGVTVAACTARYDSFSFQPRGHAGTFGTLTLVNRKGRERRVVVDMVGRMRIE